MNLASYEFPLETLTALTEASAAINSTLELTVVLDQIARSAAGVLRAEAASVLTLDRVRNRLVFAAAYGVKSEALIGREFDADLGIAGHVIRTGRAENVLDVSANPDFFPGIDEQGEFKTRGMIAAPMVYQSQPIGVLEVINRVDGDVFDQRDEKLLEIFANLAACGARNALAHERLRKENLALRGSVLGGARIIGSSPPVVEMLSLADRVAPTASTVLLVGPTGTGKEVLAKYIHAASTRNDNAFIAVNCAALAETLLESELFGHEKGAFTGATAQHLGRFELADHGTLFLDEIGDISASTQVKLLRVLQEKTFTRVGGTKTISCDVRIIAATNRDLKAAIAEKKFREDLYYRLNVFPIPLPPLSDRRGDIPALVEHFLASACAKIGGGMRRPTLEAINLLTAYQWPGNIRELANVIERAVLLADGEELLPAHLPPEITGGDQPTATGSRSLRDNERSMVVKALEECDWNQSQAARLLGISRDNLRYRVKKYNVKRPDRT